MESSLGDFQLNLSDVQISTKLQFICFVYAVSEREPELLRSTFQNSFVV